MWLALYSPAPLLLYLDASQKYFALSPPLLREHQTVPPALFRLRNFVDNTKTEQLLVRIRPYL